MLIGRVLGMVERATDIESAERAEAEALASRGRSLTCAACAGSAGGRSCQQAGPSRGRWPRPLAPTSATSSRAPLSVALRRCTVLVLYATLRGGDLPA